jgi:curli biogenesis system outer membrane secretion channel CsgG
LKERRDLMSGGRQRSVLALAVLGSVSWLALGSTPVSGYQREVQAAAEAVSERLAAAGKRSVAVVDFTDLQGEPTELGRFLAEEISVALVSSSRPLEVVDRTNLKVLLQEHKLAATGLIDPATAKKLGQIAGVDALVTGTLTPFGDTVRLTLKVLDTATARIVAAATAEIPKTKAIEELVARGVGGEGASSEREKQKPATVGMPKPVEWEGLRFTLKRCVGSGGTVRCDVLVENLTETATGLSVCPTGRMCSTPYSYLYDSSGNQYGADVALGGKERSNREQIFPGVPLAARLTFREIPADVRVASLSLGISVGIGVLGGDKKEILFRDAPLTR